MEFDLSYAHRRFLGLAGREAPAVEKPEELQISSRAFEFLHRQLQIPGRHRSGPLFGYVEQGRLWIEYAASSGYRATNDPLTFSPEYVLGWIDALRATFPERPLIDWVGSWMIQPHAELTDAVVETQWVRQARLTRLVDDRRCLMFVGWQRGTLCSRTYLYDPVSGPETIVEASEFYTPGQRTVPPANSRK